MAATLFLTLIPMAALGAALGFLGGLFGIGGGIVAIPVLVLALGMDQATAQGTALVMMAPNLVLAWWRYIRRNPVAPSHALSIAAAATLTTWAAAGLAQWLDPSLLRLLFVGFLMAQALPMMVGRAGTASEPAGKARVGLCWLPLVGLLGGGSMGLLGVGGGLVATPLLCGPFGLGQRVAQSLALGLVTPSALVALATYAGNQRVDWPVGLALAGGGALTVAAGVAVAHAWPERLLRRLFGWMLAASALWLLLGRT